MFSNLVESDSNAQENGKQRAYFGFATILYSLIFAAVLIWSIFSFDVSAVNADSNLLLETLVAPAPVIENIPPQPPQIEPQKALAVKDAPRDVDVFRDPVANINNSTAPPKGIASDRRDIDEVRAGVPYVVGTEKRYAAGTGGNNPEGRGAIVNPPIETKTATDIDDAPPPVQPAKSNQSQPASVRKPPPISKGVVNSIAKSLPKPVYPAIAKAANVAGAVNVQVTIDENGNVISAVATSGHPFLKAAAQAAARQAKFTPTTLSGEPVKVTGVIVYNFAAQ